MVQTLSENTTSSLRLNFIPLKEQRFTFNVYRCACISSSEHRDDDDLFRYSLPRQAGDEARQDYWVAFTPQNEMDLFQCNQDDNRRLTVRFLSYILSQNVQAEFPPKEYDIKGLKFRHGLDIITRHHDKGLECIWIEPHYLTPAHKFGFLLDFHFRKSISAPFDKTVQILSLSLDRDGRSNRNFYSDKYRKLHEFLGQYKDRIFSSISNETTIEVNTELEPVIAERLAANRYVLGNDNEAASSFSGLDKYGPLATVAQPIRFALVYGASDKPLVAELANALMGRIADVPFKGLKRMFKLEVGKSCLVEVPKITMEAVQGIVAKLREEKTKNSNSVLVPLIVMTRTDEETYRRLKHDLLEQGFAIQVVSTELIRNRSTFKWAVSNIALQIFAKAGGKPWRVVPTTERCLIFGIGQAHDQNNQGKIDCYFSYLVCTDSTGLYKRSDMLGDSTSEDKYLTQLHDNIIKLMREEINTGYTRCVLHVPFKVRTRELEAIQTAITNLQKGEKSAQTDFVVMRVNSETKFFGYAYTNSLIPLESTYVRVSNSPRSYLVWFEGLQLNNPSVSRRISGPVQIEFYWSKNDLNRDDERALLQDILNLSGCNWRGFNAKHLPISIFYCQQIAKYMRLFKDSPVHFDATPYPWFL